MDEKLINQFAFEIFSRARILEIEFKIFDAETRLKKVESEGPNPALTKMGIEDKQFPMTKLIIQSQVNQHKQELEELKSQLEKFREQKQINK